MPNVDDSDKEEFLNVVTYQPRDLYEAGISLIEPSCDIDFKSPVSSLGYLHVLPIELFDLVVRYSDMHTVSTLRYINRQTRLAVDTSSPYKEIVSCAPHIRATFERTSIASHFSVEKVWFALTNLACHVCGNFGMYLWIPECIRCCFTCLREDPNLMPMPERDAQAAFGLTKSQIAKIPVTVTLPGEYTVSQTSRQRRVRLVSHRHARQLGVVVRGGEEGLTKYISSSGSKAKAAYDQRVAARNRIELYDSSGRIVNTLDDIHRYQSIVHFPYLDRSSYTIHLGLACHGCQDALERGLDLDLSPEEDDALIRLRDQTYTGEGMLEHVKKCPDAQCLWKAHLQKNASPHLEQVLSPLISQ